MLCIFFMCAFRPFLLKFFWQTVQGTVLGSWDPVLVLGGGRGEVCWGEGEKEEAMVESSMLDAVMMLTTGEVGGGGVRFQRRSWREER